MQFFIDAVLFVAGLALLLKGAAVFTGNASRMAKGLGVPDMIIGITLVAFTTSLPELSVSALSSFRGFPGIAVGNVVGSNIANVGLVLGIAAILTRGIRAQAATARAGRLAPAWPTRA